CPMHESLRNFSKEVSLAPRRGLVPARDQITHANLRSLTPLEPPMSISARTRICTINPSLFKVLNPPGAYRLPSLRRKWEFSVVEPLDLRLHLVGTNT